MAIGTAGYHYIEGWPWFDGFYMVVTTLTTIGYQEVHPLSHAGRVFNVFVILAGVSLLLLGVGALSQALLEFELQSFFGRRRMEREIGRLDGHYIICGWDAWDAAWRASWRASRSPFVIIENNEAKRQRFTAENWLVLAGDATQEQTLRAGADRAGPRPDRRHHHRRHQSLHRAHRARAESASEDHCAGQRRCAEKHLLTAGADSVVSPYSFAGQRIAQSLLRPHVVSFLDTATTHLGMDLEIGEIHITPASAFAGKTIESSRIRQERGVIVLAIKRREAHALQSRARRADRGGRLPDCHGRARATAPTGTDGLVLMRTGIA